MEYGARSLGTSAKRLSRDETTLIFTVGQRDNQVTTIWIGAVKERHEDGVRDKRDFPRHGQDFGHV